MIEYVTLDYEGEPVTIENGEIWEADPPDQVWDDWLEEFREDGIYWDSDDVEWKVEKLDECGNDRRDYGMGWEDCNTDWRSW